jgi:hypothetical protein
MPKNPGAFSANDRVLHSVYGLGTVREVNERHTTIVFDDSGTRKFVTSVVKLEHSSTPAPAKPARVKKTKSPK